MRFNPAVLTLPIALIVLSACAGMGPRSDAPAMAPPAVAAWPAVSAAPVVAAERAFAADGLTMGLDGSFLKWSTTDAILIGGGGASRAHAILDPSAVFNPAEPSLAWWPNWAGIAMSGDLGFTTGGVAIGGARTGHYFTVWQLQADGSWKWVYDGGTGASSADVPGPETEPMILATASVGSASPEAAMTEVRAAEAILAAGAATDQRAAHLAALADDGRIYVAPLPPAIGRTAYSTALAGWPATFAFQPPTGGGASRAGDMAWTYGPAAFALEGQARTGWYVHMWQKRTEGWKLVFSQLLPTRLPAPAAAG